MTKKKKQEPESNLMKPAEYGNPEYSSKEDIYSKDEKVPFKEDESDADAKEARSGDTETGEDLDIPGAELDDLDEEIGEEDEENNYYSLGGDNHDDLEEDKA